jgi:hypothetical protein
MLLRWILIHRRSCAGTVRSASDNLERPVQQDAAVQHHELQFLQSCAARHKSRPAVQRGWCYALLITVASGRTRCRKNVARMEVWKLPSVRIEAITFHLQVPSEKYSYNSHRGSWVTWQNFDLHSGGVLFESRSRSIFLMKVSPWSLYVYSETVSWHWQRPFPQSFALHRTWSTCNMIRRQATSATCKLLVMLNNV